jgi:hypothetical protein
MQYASKSRTWHRRHSDRFANAMIAAVVASIAITGVLITVSGFARTPW